MKYLFVALSCLVVSSCTQTTDQSTAGTPALPAIQLKLRVWHFLTAPVGADSVVESAYYITSFDSVQSVVLNSLPATPLRQDIEPDNQLFPATLHLDGTADTLTLIFSHSTHTYLFTLREPEATLRSPAFGTALQRSAPFALSLDPNPHNCQIQLADDSAEVMTIFDTTGTISLNDLSAFRGPSLRIQAAGGDSAFVPIQDSDLFIEGSIATGLSVDYRLK